MTETISPEIQKLNDRLIRKHIEKCIQNGELFLECRGMRDVQEGHQFGFTVDKSRYFVRFEETEGALKIIIEPK